MPSKSHYWIGAGVLLFVTVMGLTYVLRQWSFSWLGSTLATAIAPQPGCNTIVTDPHPPLNVRSSPVVAADNVVGQVQNGTRLSVVSEQEGWLQVQGPIAGWIYKELTTTVCPSPHAISSPVGVDLNRDTLEQATEQYHAGNLAGAVGLAKSILPSSPVYAEAQAAIARWQQDWPIAESRYYTARQALATGRWQDVLDQVKDFPDNRFWREKLTPLVRQAIEKQAQVNRQP